MSPVEFAFDDPNILVIEISHNMEKRYIDVPKNSMLRNTFLVQMAMIKAIEVIREDPTFIEGMVYDVLNSIYMRHSNQTIKETTKSPTTIINEIFNYSNYWDSVYDALDKGLNNAK